MNKVTNQKQALIAIAKGQEFALPTLSARHYMNEMRNTGRLDGEDYDMFYECNNLNTGGLWYVVYSYGTPIAWQDCTTDEWYLVKQKFSVTTSKHQNIVRRATGFIRGKGVAA